MEAVPVQDDSFLIVKPTKDVGRGKRVPSGKSQRMFLIDSGNVSVAVSSTELVRQVAAGFPTSVLTEIPAVTFYSKKDLENVVISRRTADRRAKAGRLSPDESDRIVRLLRVTEMAERTFGEGQAAETWMRAPKPFLDGQSPLDALRTEAGGRIVEEELLAIQHGFAA